MNTKLTILQQYKKYLNAINKDNGSSIPSLYKKFDDFLEKELSEGMDGELYFMLKTNSVFATLRQVWKKQVVLKNLSPAWNKKAVQECYKLVNLLENEYTKDELITKLDDSYKINFARLSNLFLDTEDPCTKLYLYLVFYNTRSGQGRRFFSYRNSDMVRLMKASSEEEIEELLKVQVNEKKPSFASTFKYEEKYPKTELFKMFPTPKSMAEQSAMLIKLEEMATNGEISYDDYSYVKNILLNHPKHFFDAQTEKDEGAAEDEEMPLFYGGDLYLEELTELEEAEIDED